MSTLVDPRSGPAPQHEQRAVRTTTKPDELEELHRLCREGRLYDVERWIQADRPRQVTEDTSLRARGRWRSALEIGLEDGNHALVLLLLCNGYDANQEPRSPLDIALRTRRRDVLDLLLKWGADPQRVDLEYLFGTYDSGLFERFRDVGVDLTADHVLAETLGYHTSNKPLFGYAKRHREDDPRIQTELNIALAEHAKEGNLKGVSLCLWAGADPHAPAPDLRYGSSGEDEDEDLEEEDRFEGFTAVFRACHYGHVEVLKRLGPDPARDDFDELYGWADNDAVIDLLAEQALPQDVSPVIREQLWRLSFDLFGRRSWRSLYVLRRLFEVGTRWRESTTDEIAGIRRHLLKASDDNFVDVLKLFTTADYCSPEILEELTRTPAIRKRMKKVGFFRRPGDERDGYYRRRPTRSQEVLKKCGIELPKPPLPHTVQIGQWRSGRERLRLERAELFDRVWSEPISTLAKEWAVSGRGLSKACERLKIPVPSRGYWAKLRAGIRVRRPRLPKLPAGQGEEVVVYLREDSAS